MKIPYIISKGKLFQNVKLNGHWYRYRLPFDIPEIITPKFVSDLICRATTGSDAIGIEWDGLPHPYTRQDTVEYISAMLSADENETFAFAITVDKKVIGSIGIFRQGSIHRQTGELGYYISE